MLPNVSESLCAHVWIWGFQMCPMLLCLSLLLFLHVGLKLFHYYYLFITITINISVVWSSLSSFVIRLVEVRSSQHIDSVLNNCRNLLLSRSVMKSVASLLFRPAHCCDLKPPRDRWALKKLLIVTICL